VSGSSGTGPLATDQEVQEIVTVLERVAAETAPIRARFGPVRRFAGSDVFYLSFVDEAPLRALHDRIARSGLRFQPTPFAFTPHCTLRTRTPITDDEVRDLESVRVAGDFVLDTMSLYDLPVERAAAPTSPGTGFATLLCLLHRTTLRGV
jgi:2'-5' RNA ligase